MIIEATAADFAVLRNGKGPRGLRLVSDSLIAAPEVLDMLAGLAASIEPTFSPSAWMIVEDDEVVGLCSVTRVPQQGALDIGYGVAPSRQGRGAADRAIGELVAWARADDRISRMTAETALDNAASQRVLERNGFVRNGRREDPEDGLLIRWEVVTTTI